MGSITPSQFSQSPAQPSSPPPPSAACHRNYSDSQDSQDSGQSGQSGQPRLSPSQKAYRDNPGGFLEKLQARSENLFRDGYDVWPADVPHTFVVAHRAANRNAGAKVIELIEYVVCPLQETCSCPFYTWQMQGDYLGENDNTLIPCKHLQGLPKLMREARASLGREGNIRALAALWSHWMMVVSAKRRRRQEAEWAAIRQFNNIDDANNAIKASIRKG